MTEQEEKIIVRVDSDLEDLIPGFLKNRQKDIQAIEEALAREDYEAVRILGHGMKGVGGGYGFEAVTEFGRSLEEAAKGKNPEEIKRWAEELSRYLELVEVVCG